MKKSLHFALLIIFLLSGFLANAQIIPKDRIITKKGNILHGNVKHIRKDEIVYRKYFRRHTIDVDKVLYVQDRDGQRTQINDIKTAKNYKKYTPSGDGAAFKPHTIERIGKSFLIDSSRIVGIGKLNGLIAESPNPVVKLNLKTAKLIRTFGIISTISSYPSSMGGAFASYTTIKTLSDQMKAGPVSFKSYMNTGLSFLGTISLPITTGILKKAQKKAYDKTLVLYSMGM
jgi:hypothetical protein